MFISMRRIQGTASQQALPAGRVAEEGISAHNKKGQTIWSAIQLVDKLNEFHTKVSFGMKFVAYGRVIVARRGACSPLHTFPAEKGRFCL